MSGEDTEKFLISKGELRAPEASGELRYIPAPTNRSPVNRGSAVMAELSLAGARSEIERLSLENEALRRIIISLHLENAERNAAFLAYRLDPSSIKSGEKFDRLTPVPDELEEESSQEFRFDEVDSTSADAASISSQHSLQTDSSEITVLRNPQMGKSPAESFEHQTPVGQSVTEYHTHKSGSRVGSSSHSEGSTTRIAETDEEKTFNIQFDELMTKITGDDGSLDILSDIKSPEAGEGKGKGPFSNTVTSELVPRATGSTATSDTGSDTKTTGAIREEGTPYLWPNQTSSEPLPGSSIYDIPDNFDPDQEDYGLSDVETVTSGEALSAWGIEESPLLDQTRETPVHGEATYESDDDEGEGWEAVNKSCCPAPGPQLFHPQAPIVTAPPGNSTWNIHNPRKGAEGDGREDNDDILTILGDPYPKDTVIATGDDEKVSTIADTGSDGCVDGRYQDVEQIREEMVAEHMEKERAKAEREEMDKRDREYCIAIAEKVAGAAKKEDTGSYRNPDKEPMLSLSAPLVDHLGCLTISEEGRDITYERSLNDMDMPQKDTQITPTDNANKATQNAIDCDDPGLRKRFNDIWSTLTPTVLTAPTNVIAGRHNPVGWISPGPKPTMDNTQVLSRVQLADLQITGKPVSETERILSSFDPREDVIGILRPKAKGEKNLLDSKATSEAPKKIKPTKSVNRTEAPVRKVGEIEGQFRILREKQLERNAAQKKLDAISEIPPKTVNTISRVETLEILHSMESLNINKLASDNHPITQTPILAGQMLTQVKAPTAPSRAPKASHKISLSPSSRRRNPRANTSPLLKQVIPRPLSHNLLDDEPELSHQKSLRFHDLSTTNATPKIMRPQPTQPSTVAQNILPPVVAPESSKPLVSILKSPVLVETPVMLPRNRTYNYEHIREVLIRNLPKDITYSSFLDQVSGGLLEKAIIDWKNSEGRIVFAEPEAARNFFKRVEQTGFCVHTKIPPGTGPLGNDNPGRCALSGFLWTQHSSEMTPKMIQGIWKHRASRCLILNNFPKDITVAKLTKDILGVLSEPSIREKDIIETVVINHNLKASSTGLLARVRFSAIMLALKVGKGLHNSSPDYTGVGIMYDVDPCGGLIGKEPPSSVTRSKEMLNDNHKGQAPVKPLEPQQKLVSSTQSTPKLPIAKRAQAGQVSLPKLLGAQSRHIAPKPPRQKRPFNPSPQGQATGFPPAKGPSAPQQTKATEVVLTTRPPAAIAGSQVVQNPVPPPRIFGHSYDNWYTDPAVAEPRPKGAHWNHKEPHLVREYNDAISNSANKRARKDSDTSRSITMEKSRIEYPRADRLVYLTNLPRNFHVARLFRFIRGGMVEHVELMPPTSKYNTSSAIIVFAHRHSVKTYKNYLNSPGLTIEHNHRVVYTENVAQELMENIRLLASHSIRNDGLTRCLRVDLLPKDTMLGEFVGIIEEGMNHSNLEFEHASIGVSEENQDTAVAILRLMTIGTAIFVVNVLRKNYDDINITFDNDPCEGPVEELDEVNLEIRS